MKKTSKRVLLVEDEEDVRDILEDEFNRHGFEVVTTASADLAASRLDSEGFDVLVTDVETPGRLSGIDLVQMARKKDPPLPTVLVTGHAAAVQHELTPLEHLVSKPFPLTHIVEAVERLLESIAR